MPDSSSPATAAAWSSSSTLTDTWPTLRSLWSYLCGDLAEPFPGCEPFEIAITGAQKHLYATKKMLKKARKALGSYVNLNITRDEGNANLWRLSVEIDPDSDTNVGNGALALQRAWFALATFGQRLATDQPVALDIQVRAGLFHLTKMTEDAITINAAAHGHIKPSDTTPPLLAGKELVPSPYGGAYIAIATCKREHSIPSKPTTGGLQTRSYGSQTPTESLAPPPQSPQGNAPHIAPFHIDIINDELSRVLDVPVSNNERVALLREYSITNPDHLPVASQTILYHAINMWRHNFFEDGSEGAMYLDTLLSVMVL